MRRSSPYIVLMLLVVALGSTTLLAAPAAFAAPAQGQTVTVSVGDSATVVFARPAEHVAAYWQGSENAHVTLAFSSDGVHFGDAVDAGRDDAGGAAPNGMTYGAVLAANGAAAVRVTTDTPLGQLSLVGISPGDSVGPGQTLVEASDLGTDQPRVISRAGWGANPAYLNWAPQFYPAKKVILHHTADGTSPEGTQESYAKLVRSIYYYHAVTRDWGDIAYNFLIDPLGNIYEGRYSDSDSESPPGEDIYGNGVRGGHTYNYNTGTVGIAVLGTYVNHDISAAARASLEELTAWVVERHGIDPLGSEPYYSPFSAESTIQTWNIAGHRDYGSTDCPGQAFYSTLPVIRQDVFGLTGLVTAPGLSHTYLRIVTSPSSPVIGQELTVTATLVEESSRQPLPGCVIAFASGGVAGAQTPLGTAKTDSFGVATLHTVLTAAGMRWLTAEFDPGTSSSHRGSTTSDQVNVALSGLSAAPGNTKVQLSWNAAPDVSGYNIYRDGVKVTPVPVTSTGYLDTGLTNEVTYSYQVTAIVNGRESAKSSAVGATPGGAFFLDVSPDHSYYQAIQSLADAGIVNGKSDGKFYPDDAVIRQQFAKMIVLGCDYPVSESDTCTFKDVTKSGAASLYPDNYVAVCAANKITMGKTAAFFDPYTNITRAQVVSMVVRAAHEAKPSALSDPPADWEGVLPDSDPTHGRNIALAEYSGLLSGIDLSAFSIMGKATRAEIAQIICNLREK